MHAVEVGCARRANEPTNALAGSALFRDSDTNESPAFVVRDNNYVSARWPGDVHTLIVPDGVTEMATLFHVTGSYVYVGADGAPTGVEDVFSKLEKARAHYARVGLGADYVDRLIR